MTAGTAQKIALNLFSTQLMIELGRVYQGLMVNVVPANAKLVARSHRIVQAIAGCDLGRRGRRLGARRPGHQARRAPARRAGPADADGHGCAEARAICAGRARSTATHR